MQAVTYYRVSTAAQGRSGLGLEAQRTAVEAFCKSRTCEVLAEYVEVESGTRNDRPELTKALHHARITGATLVVAKMDRLSRNAAFLLTLRDSSAKLIAADQPDVNELTVGILAVIAQDESKRVSERTAAALQVAKTRGVKLGNPNGAAALRRAGAGNTAAVRALVCAANIHALDLAPVIEDLRNSGCVSLRDLATGLNARRMKTPRGGMWHATSVKNMLERLDSLSI